MKKEVSKYKEIAKKSKVTTNTVEIVKEVSQNPFGLSKKEVEDLSYRNVVLELEVKRL